MANPQFRRTIRIDEDGIATFERHLMQVGSDGEETPRLVETKRVDAMALLPHRGAPSILPPNCRFVDTEERRAVFVVEEPPTVRTVRWVTEHEVFTAMKQRLRAAGGHHLWGESAADFDRRLEEQHTFRLAFPYVIFCYTFVDDAWKQVSFWYRTHPLDDDRAELLVPNVPNRSPEYGYLCLTHEAKAMPPSDVAVAAAVVDREFWNGVWNQDHAVGFLALAAKIPEVASPWEWERHSIIDPTFVRRVSWPLADRTMNQVLRYELQRPEDGDRAATFACFERHLRAADPYDAAPPPAESALKPSTARAVTLADERVLQVGDALTFRKAIIPGCVPGERYAVEWFSRPDPAQGRLVKMAGIERPLPLVVGGALLGGIDCTPATAPAEAITASGATLLPGVICAFADKQAWPHRNGAAVVQSVSRGPRGAILAQFRGEHFRTAVGEGDMLFPGVRVFPREERDGNGYRRGGVRLADGRVVDRGTKVAFHDSHHGYGGTGTVTGIALIERGATGYTAVLGNGNRVPLATFDGALLPTVAVLVEQLDQEVAVGPVRVRIGDRIRWGDHGGQIIAFSPAFADGCRYAQLRSPAFGTRWVCLARGSALASDIRIPPAIERDGVAITVGARRYAAGDVLFDAAMSRVRTVERFTEQDDGRIVVRFADNTREAFLGEDDAVVDRFTPVALAHEVGGTSIRRGMRLRLRVAVGDLPAGTRLCVSHVVLTDGAPPLVVTSRGLGFHATPGAAISFERRSGVRWVPFDLGDAPEPSVKVWKAVEGIEVGCRVRYLGGAFNVNWMRPGKSEEIAKRTLATVTTAVGGHVECQFDDNFPGLWGVRQQNIDAIHLLRIDGTGDLRTVGFTTVFTRRARGSRIVNAGAPAGADSAGNTLHVGDRVRVLEFTSASTKGALALAKRQHIFTIVHTYASPNRRWVFVDAGEDVGYSPDGLNVEFTQAIPPEYNHDPTWWARLSIAESHRCTFVERRRS